MREGLQDSAPISEQISRQEETTSLADRLTGAWGCWAPSLTGDGARVAYISDRRGSPELWVQDVDAPDRPQVIELSGDPVLAVHWSPDGRWLACALATRGGVRTEVWLVRPDGSGGHRLAGDPEHAVLGPWTRTGRRLAVMIAGYGVGEINRNLLFDPETGASELVVSGELTQVLDLSPDERFALVREGPRGVQNCRLLDRATGVSQEVLPESAVGSTDFGTIRPGPPGDPSAVVTYVVTDAGSVRRALVAAAFSSGGQRTGVGTIAEREHAEIDYADADDAGTRLLLIWNVEGRSELEIADSATGLSRIVPGLPGMVVSGGVLARNGTRAVLAVESPLAPRRLWMLDVDLETWATVTAPPPVPLDLVMPTLERFVSHDGLDLSGWLYRPVGSADGHRAGPALISLHGGPESQERPTYNPYHQALVAAGITVLAPNIRGSSGFGRSFVHADDRFGRLNAIGDVAVCAQWLIARGLADPGCMAVAGRSYGGYATLMALTAFPELFAAGVSICGMSDLLTFYAATEPWIAKAAITKYGDPDRDAELLARLSPLRQLDQLRAPLLVVHGEGDTNVPVSESTQLVAALRERDWDVEYLELEGEGHEYQRISSRRTLLVTMSRFLARTIGP